MLSTYTARQCVSACLLAFLAGDKRYLGSHGRLGFHSASIAGQREEGADLGNEVFRDVLTQRGASSAFITRALTTAPSDMWYPTTEELSNAHIITEVVDESRFGQTGITHWRDREKLEEELLAVPVFAAMAKAEPEYFNGAKNEFLNAVQNGLPQSQASAKLRSVLLNRILPKYLEHGSNTPLLAYWNSQVTEMRELRAIDPKECVHFAYQTPDDGGTLSKLLSKQTQETDLGRLVDLLNAGADDAALPAQSAVRPSLIKAMHQIEQEMPGSTQFVVRGARSDPHPKELCDAVIYFYSAILSFPQEESAPPLKYLAAQK
jgi:hypothetical protein